MVPPTVPHFLKNSFRLHFNMHGTATPSSPLLCPRRRPTEVPTWFPSLEVFLFPTSHYLYLVHSSDIFAYYLHGTGKIGGKFSNAYLKLRSTPRCLESRFWISTPVLGHGFIFIMSIRLVRKLSSGRAFKLWLWMSCCASFSGEVFKVKVFRVVPKERSWVLGGMYPVKRFLLISEERCSKQWGVARFFTFFEVRK